MTYEINWYSTDPKVLDHQYYIQFSALPLSSIDPALVKAALTSAVYSKESAPIVAYLSGLLRVLNLLG